MDTNAGSATGLLTNTNNPVPSLSGSSLYSDFYAWKAQLEELADDDDDYSRKRTAEEVIEELGFYSGFMHRCLDRRQNDSGLLKLVLPDNIQAELVDARDDLEAAWTDRIMAYLSEKAAILVAKSKSGLRSIELEDDFSKLGRQVAHACGTIRVYNADIDHEQWQRFVPRCVNHNIHAIIRRLLEAHKQFQASSYLSNNKEHVRLWYLIRHNLCQTFKLLQRNEDRFPSADYCIESSFFRTKEIRELFEFSAHQADFFIPREIENIVGYYCEIINDHHSQTKPKSGHLQGLSEKKPLSATAISTLTKFPRNERWDSAALKALHWATIRMNYLAGGPMMLRRNGAMTGASTLDGPQDQVVLEHLDSREELDAEELSYGSSLLEGDLTSTERASETPAMDIDNILEDSVVTTPLTAPDSAIIAPKEASSLVETASTAMGPQTSLEPTGELAFECRHSPADSHESAAASPYVSARASSASSPYIPPKFSASRDESGFNGLPTPRSLPFSSSANYEDVMDDHHRNGEDIESQDSVSMDIPPTSDDIPQAVNGAATATKATVQWPFVDGDVLSTSEHDDVDDNDLFVFQRPKLRGQNRVSAYGYVYCPFPENRKYEVANSRLISRDLRDPGIVSDGLRIQDLVNLPPPHCRTLGNYTTWKKRTPFGPYEVFKMFGSAIVRKTVRRKCTPIARPRFPPSVTSRASCQHYKHVFAAKRDLQSRVAKPSERRMPILRGGGVRDGRRVLRRSSRQPTAGLRERAPDSPTPAGPRQRFQRHAMAIAPANGLESRSRSRSQSQVSVVDLTNGDHPAVVGAQENNGDDLGSIHLVGGVIIHEDSAAGSQGISDSSGASPNKENSRRGFNGDSRRPLEAPRTGRTPMSSGHSPFRSPGSAPSSASNTSDLGQWLRCHPCPVYPDQYHHQCRGRHCAGLSPRRRLTPPAPRSAETTRVQRPLGGEDATPPGSPAQGVHHSQVPGNQPAQQDGSPSHRDFAAQNPQDTAQETLGALPGGARVNTLHERLRVERANTERRRTIDRLRDDLHAWADDIDRYVRDTDIHTILDPAEAELLRNEANNLWPRLRQATDLDSWQTILYTARVRLYGDFAPEDFSPEGGPTNGDTETTEPAGHHGQSPAQHLAHVARRGLAALDVVLPSVEHTAAQNNNYDAGRGPARGMSHHDEETAEEVHQQPDNELPTMNDLLDLGERRIETLNSLVLQWGTLHDVDLRHRRFTEEKLPEAITEWVIRERDVGSALNDAAEADDWNALDSALQDADQVIGDLGNAIQAITGYNPMLSSDQLRGHIQGLEAGLMVEHEELLDAITRFLRVPLYIRDALQAAEDALQEIRALTDDTNHTRLQEVVKIADRALDDMDQAKERYQKSKSTSGSDRSDGSEGSDGSDGTDQTRDDDLDAYDQLQHDLNNTTSFLSRPGADQLHADNDNEPERRAHPSSSDSSSGDETESDTAPPSAKADSPKGRGVARKASAAARQRHLVTQSAQQAATPPRSTIRGSKTAAARARPGKRTTRKRPQKKGAHEPEHEDPKTKKGKRKDDGSDDDHQSGGNFAQPVRRSTRVAAKATATAQTGTTTQSTNTTKQNAAKTGPKAGGRGGRKRAAPEDDDDDKSLVAQHDSASNSTSSARFSPRKKPKNVAFVSGPSAATTNINADDSSLGQNQQQQRKSSLADQKLAELRDLARARLRGVYARHGLELFG